MARKMKVRSLLVGAAALAVVATGVLAFAPSAVPSTLADTSGTPTTASSHRQPIVLPAPTDQPVLSAIEGASLVAPGGLVKVDGLNLGSDAGSLCLRWSEIIVQNEFTRSGQACLAVLDWQPTRIIASVPSGWVGVTDQLAELIATRSDGAQSNETPINFFARRQVVNVYNSTATGNPVFIQCSDAASDTNTCNTNGASHANGLCCSTADFVGAVGQDAYYLDLHFGWALQSASVTTTEGQSSISHQPSVGATGGNVTVFWEAGGYDGSASYNLAITIIGPVGVPFN
jgi:hypothetical protein